MNVRSWNLCWKKNHHRYGIKNANCNILFSFSSLTLYSQPAAQSSMFHIFQISQFVFTLSLLPHLLIQAFSTSCASTCTLLCFHVHLSNRGFSPESSSALDFLSIHAQWLSWSNSKAKFQKETFKILPRGPSNPLWNPNIYHLFFFQAWSASSCSHTHSVFRQTHNK